MKNYVGFQWFVNVFAFAFSIRTMLAVRFQQSFVFVKRVILGSHVDQIRIHCTWIFGLSVNFLN